jgi:1,4-dihydroxy-2-naphthoyl-CoA hydrolase
VNGPDRAAGLWFPAVAQTPTQDVTSGFDRHYGLEMLSVSDEEVVGRVVTEPHHLQPFGLVHGGVFASIAESLASIGTFYGVRDDGMAAMGLSNQTSFLRPMFGGTIHAVARRRHRGRSTWVWEVDVTDDDGRLCALVRMTIAVREARPVIPPSPAPGPASTP